LIGLQIKGAITIHGRGKGRKEIQKEVKRPGKRMFRK
jgi:hypothetical protein